MPEQRLNIHGHLVTKHVRTGDQTTQSTAKSIPAPQASPDSAVAAPLLAKKLKLRCPGLRIKDLDPEAVVLVETLLEKAGTDGYGHNVPIDDEMAELARRFHENDDSGQCFFNNFAAFGKSATRDYNNRIENYINGFKNIPEFSGIYDFLKQGTEERRQQAVALVEFASSFGQGPASMEFISYGYENDDEGYEVSDEYRKVYVKDADLRQLVMDHPKRVSEIVELVSRDYITDAGHLREILEHGQQSLRDGLL